MTAEIAVLNKSAVALASDSAVTISSGVFPSKIFETADKLFELSENLPIGIMVYNGMQFLGVPIDTIIKSFRRNDDDYATVADAAEDFLLHLNTYVDEAPEAEIRKSIAGVIGPIAIEINQRISERVEKATIARLTNDQPLDDIHDMEAIAKGAVEEVLGFYERQVKALGKAEYIPRPDKKTQKAYYRELIGSVVNAYLSGFAEKQADRIGEICTAIMASGYVSSAKTGIVFAGFGLDERFPTLVSYEIDGLHEVKIRIKKTDECDIDRNGMRAYVRPFAQQDMVERFLHGLDEQLRNDITTYCAQTVGKISDGLFEKLQFEDDVQREELLKLAKEAEAAFTRNLNEQAFASFQHKSRREIEDMVEFMPKPELAKMAEALIDLTSIKRKVSEGPETVGGPVDVAVISKSDGFVWVKRKHYFPSELNNRYFKRI